MTKTRVYLDFFSRRRIDINALSDLAGVKPTKVETKEERRGRPQQFNSFQYGFPVYKGWNIETLFNKLIKSIQHPKELGEYCRENGIKVKLNIVIEGITDTYSVPACYFSSRFISFLAMLNASIDHDIFTEPWQMGDDYDKESGLKVIP